METTGHRYTVELRVYGPHLDPDAVTRESGLKPSSTRLAGSRWGERTHTDSVWAFDGNGPYDWESLEEGLAFVLDRLGTSQKLFAKYGADHGVIWWCGHFQSRFDGGPVLSAGLLERLGAFGAELFIDNYFSKCAPAEESPSGGGEFSAGSDHDAHR
jgi:uncharacterized protein DUF4279